VPTDAVDAVVNHTATQTAEVVDTGDTAAVRFTGTLGSVPLDTLTAGGAVTFTDGVETFTDSTYSGILTGSEGGSGLVNYGTGEYELNFNAAPLAVSITATYRYILLHFAMNWPGVASSNYRVLIWGDPDYEDQATATFTRYIVRVSELVNGTLVPKSTFKGVSLTDPDDASYIAALLNDEDTGSRDVSVTVYGNDIAPPTLQGATQAAEAVVADVAYNGTRKSALYTLSESVSPTSLQLVFNFAVNDEDTLVANGQAVGPHAVTAIRLPIKPGSLLLTADDQVAEDAGDGTFVAPNVGTINYDTGAISVTFNVAPTLEANIILDYQEEDVILVDDGDGNLIVHADGAGTNIPDPGELATINYDSGAIAITWKRAPILGDILKALNVQTADYYSQAPASLLTLTLADGSDGSALALSNVLGATAEAATKGVYALSAVMAMLLVVVPDFESNVTAINELDTYCSLRGDRFFFFSVPEGKTPSEAVAWRNNTLNISTEWGACVYPHVKLVDPVSGATIAFPPGVIKAGLIARTAAKKNLSKSAAGTQDGKMGGVTGLTYAMNETEEGIINDAGIMGMVNWPTTGLVMWGDRLPQRGLDFRYVAEKLVMLFVQKSIYNSMFVHTFETNGPSLWQRIQIQITNFLGKLHGEGYFAGTTPAESFFVTCDASTNPPESVAIGELNFTVGIATNVPTEFIIATFTKIV